MAVGKLGLGKDQGVERNPNHSLIFLRLFSDEVLLKPSLKFELGWRMDASSCRNSAPPSPHAKAQGFVYKSVSSGFFQAWLCSALCWHLGQSPKQRRIQAEFWDEIPSSPTPGVTTSKHRSPLRYFIWEFTYPQERADHKSDLLLTFEAVLGSTGDEKRNLPKIKMSQARGRREPGFYTGTTTTRTKQEKKKYMKKV